MRESDQASLLDGALLLSRDFQTEPLFHNFSGQWGSYFLLATLQKVTTLNSLQEYVTWANYLTTILFASCLLGFVISFLVAKKKVPDLTSALLILVTLTTPTVFLNASLLSSNVLAGGALLALITTRNWWSSNSSKSPIGIICGTLLVFSAVCLRKDSALLLPLICFTSLEKAAFVSLIKKRYFWCFIIAVATALLIESVISADSYMPDFVTDVRIMGCYLTFGLMGALIVLIAALFYIFRVLKCGIFTKLILAGAILLPVLAYAPFLYSPRHLFMAGLIPLILSSSNWFSLNQIPLNKHFITTTICVALLGNTCWLTFSPRIQADGHVNAGFSYGTCYPTADGLWPFGGGAHFLYRLSQSAREGSAVDHNQELWGAWSSLVSPYDLSNYAFHTLSPNAAYTYLWVSYYHGENIRHSSSDINCEAPDGKQLIYIDTDRSWSGVGRRSYKSLHTDSATMKSMFELTKVANTQFGRLIFMDPNLFSTPNNGADWYKRRKALVTQHPGKEFILSKEKRSFDGHGYLPIAGHEIYWKTNYPEIFYKYFY